MWAVKLNNSGTVMLKLWNQWVSYWVRTHQLIIWLAETKAPKHRRQHKSIRCNQYPKLRIFGTIYLDNHTWKSCHYLPSWLVLAFLCALLLTPLLSFWLVVQDCSSFGDVVERSGLLAIGKFSRLPAAIWWSQTGLPADVQNYKSSQWFQLMYVITKLIVVMLEAVPSLGGSFLHQMSSQIQVSFSMSAGYCNSS